MVMESSIIQEVVVTTTTSAPQQLQTTTGKIPPTILRRDVADETGEYMRLEINVSIAQRIVCFGELRSSGCSSRLDFHCFPTRRTVEFSRHLDGLKFKFDGRVQPVLFDDLHQKDGARRIVKRERNRDVREIVGMDYTSRLGTLYHRVRRVRAEVLCSSCENKRTGTRQPSPWQLSCNPASTRPRQGLTSFEVVAYWSPARTCTTIFLHDKLMMSY